MHKIAFFHCLIMLLFGGLYSNCMAQQVQFKNEQGQTITIKQGDQISLFYNGYLGQKQYSNVDFLYGTDSSVFVGNSTKSFNEKASDYLLMRGLQKKEILFKDIIAFRRISIGRKVLKSTLNLLAISGFAYVLSELAVEEKLNYGQTLLYSIAGGIGITSIINITLPENPKYKMSAGWRVQTINK
jgi:hypothetical protein